MFIIICKNIDINLMFNICLIYVYAVIIIKNLILRHQIVDGNPPRRK